jgi:hypothetical protein
MTAMNSLQNLLDDIAYAAKLTRPYAKYVRTRNPGPDYSGTALIMERYKKGHWPSAEELAARFQPKAEEQSSADAETLERLDAKERWPDEEDAF